MALNKKTVDDINAKGKRVLVRCDFNVPLKAGEITDDTRIKAALPTIKKLLNDGGKVILCSHLGKVKNGPNEGESLAPVAKRLEELLGFLFALATADAYFRTGRYKHALVIGAETLSKMMNWADRSTCVLFGDGAGAAVVSAEGSQLLSMVQGSDGAGGMALHCENRPVNNLYRQLGAQHYAFTQMDGREVYKFAVRTVPKEVSEALEQAELPIEDVKYFLLHQANIRIIESVAKRLHQPMEKFPCNLQKCGNVSACSSASLTSFGTVRTANL